MKVKIRTRSMSISTEFISCSAEEIEGNDCLLTQILVRLPLRDVITFKRVSKRWRSLISAPYFRRCHATLKHRVSGLFLDSDFFWFENKKINRSCSSSSSFCPTISDLNSFLITQSCNGLMLVQSEHPPFIYNPTTSEKKTLPSPFPSRDPLRFQIFALAFDPLRFLGYKVICIIYCKTSHDDCFQTMIYSSESGVWKPGLPFRPSFYMGYASGGVYFKNSIYWIIVSESKTTLRFDLNEECLKDDMPPLPASEPRSRYHHQVLAPACGYMNFLDFESVFCIRVFQLKEDDSSSSSSSRWIPIHSLDLRSTNYKIGFDLKWYSVFYLMEDEEDEMVLLVRLRNKVVAVRLKDKSYYDVFALPITEASLSPYCFHVAKGWYRSIPYVESLASL
ncbi:hypothetical protein PIB30_063694 [Stylosanthes scabra]|uniref:F-box domain-containing protein n=1 Tax=Stylosanthes scabra TaxID=79078 RepID=A0ABU6XLP3_9FABA|nr:hypothetical protein [Stylosanthes scabra]